MTRVHCHHVSLSASFPIFRTPCHHPWNMSSRIPNVLQPFVRLPPEHSLYVISHVLGATANWLVIRYLYAALGSDYSPRRSRPAAASGDVDVQLPPASADPEGDQSPTVVVLVSWMREYEFWKTEARRAGVCSLEIRRVIPC